MTSILILQHQRPDGEVDTYHLKSGRRYHLGRGSQCQVRILDLKLSRQHCAFELGDQGWLVVDLASTNGCSVDGLRVAGTRSLTPGAVVTAGATSVSVDRILDAAEDPPAAHAQPAAATPRSMAIPSTPAGGTPEPWPEQDEGEDPRASDRLAAMASRSNQDHDDLEPQSTPNRVTQSDPLIPALVAPKSAAIPPSAASAVIDHDILATLQPGHRASPQRATAPAPAPANASLPAAAADQPAAESGSRTFYINVLGRRVGPLSKAQARELKTKELKGSLTPSDLANLEAEASLAPQTASESAGGDEQRTYYITLLGKRVGPLTRTQARELKARELRGMLPADEVDRLLVR